MGKKKEIKEAAGKETGKDGEKSPVVAARMRSKAITISKDSNR
jgi:hypothetical protein